MGRGPLRLSKRDLRNLHTAPNFSEHETCRCLSRNAQDSLSLASDADDDIVAEHHKRMADAWYVLANEQDWLVIGLAR